MPIFPSDKEAMHRATIKSIADKKAAIKARKAAPKKEADEIGRIAASLGLAPGEMTFIMCKRGS